MNLDSGETISIRELVEFIADLTGFEGDIDWNILKPDDQPRRKLVTSRTKEWIGWDASTASRDGLRETIEWYEDNRDAIVDD